MVEVPKEKIVIDLENASYNEMRRQAANLGFNEAIDQVTTSINNVKEQYKQ